MFIKVHEKLYFQKLFINLVPLIKLVQVAMLDKLATEVQQLRMWLAPVALLRSRP